MNWCIVIIYVSFYMLSAKKLSIPTDFTCFLTLDKIQDGDHVWWRDRPQTELPPIKHNPRVKNIKGFPLKAKSFRNAAIISAPLVPPREYDFAYTSEG